MSKLEHRVKKRETQVVSFHIPKTLLSALDKLVEEGVFNNRSEAIRMAILKLVLEYANAFNSERSSMLTTFR